MSSESQPINPARFASALRDLPATTLALKIAELRNSIAHLDYSNAELKPFAEGRASALPNPSGTSGAVEPDQDCIDAIAENEAVIARMQQRIELIRAEVETNRGLVWSEFMGKTGEEEEEVVVVGDEQDEAARVLAEMALRERGTNGTNGTTAGSSVNGVNGHSSGSGQQQQHPAWQDGTFQTGTINGAGGLSDEELLRQLLGRMPPENDDTDDPEGGMHL
ncbi:uncharacterized protein GGS25DRAFT_220424 [Hypoxylon fragiforme]|uniref:uncharacterized protein n=1 Tax=Hypoxylon fragiforme TaxID=63214 RepID=UPI0020C5F9CA|nr:uncharacterized protein GGS25DRAFT_220424 [Hypoxylon fragiforme]KAI2609552.1 hypothetical protein GGS25DRAFT_220424 [Hypoxylon fragiforme]